MEIYLIRHTRVALPRGICYGQSDVALADSFTLESSRLRTLLPQHYDRVYSSPLKRCWQLATMLTSHPDKDPRLQEYNFGSWEMQPWQSINDAYAQRWFADYVNLPAPKGESYCAMQQRVLNFWQEVQQQREILESCAIVSHAGVIRVLLAHLLDIPLEKSFHLSIDTASVSLVEVYSSHSHVHYINRV